MSLIFLLKGQLAFLNKEYDVVAVSGQDENLENVKSLAFIDGCSMQGIGPLKDLVSLWNLFLSFKKEKPQIVHLHYKSRFVDYDCGNNFRFVVHTLLDSYLTKRVFLKEY
jgi:hypothetical protein